MGMANALADLGKQWDESIVPTLQANSIGKMLMPMNIELSGKGLGALSIDTFNYVARGNAQINYNIQQDIEDKVDITRDNLKIPVLQDDVVIPRRDWDAFALRGIPLEDDIANDMAANVAKQQTTLIVDGWKPDGTNYSIKGMYQVANNSVTGSDFDTFGNALKTIAECITKLKEDGVYSAGYNLSLASLNFSELLGSYSASGISEFDLVLRMLNADAGNQMPGRIFECTDLAAGTGMVAPVASQENRRYFDIVEPQEPTFSLWFADGNEESGDVKTRLLGSMVPRFKHLNSEGKDNCVCKITGLDSS